MAAAPGAGRGSPRVLPWDEAWQRALYGPAGFYRQQAGPAAHFRTGVHASGLLAEALARLARGCGLNRVVDVGAGRGELLAQLAACDPALELVGVDVVDRPLGPPERAGWLRAPGGAGLPPPELLAPAGAGALVVAHEWLDVVPCPVVEVDGAGVPRVVEVDVVDGTERPGRALGTVESSAGAAEGAADAASAAAAADLDWLRRWWPLAGSPPGTRAEVGRPRDEAWAALVRAASGAVLVAVDYAHAAGARPASGTLAGYRDGRACPPVPDGSCDVTASVALDAVAAAGAAAGAVATSLTTQRAALLALGVPAGRPDPARAVADPRGYLTALQVAGSAAELIDPGGLGSFGWLLQSTGPALPRSLR